MSILLKITNMKGDYRIVKRREAGGGWARRPTACQLVFKKQETKKRLGTKEICTTQNRKQKMQTSHYFLCGRGEMGLGWGGIVMLPTGSGLSVPPYHFVPQTPGLREKLRALQGTTAPRACMQSSSQCSLGLPTRGISSVYNAEAGEGPRGDALFPSLMRCMFPEKVERKKQPKET